MVAAADTFRAAAVEQLEIWCQRAGVEIVKRLEGSDPASVVFDALKAAKDNADVLIVDTAGRLHNKKSLMEELKKIARIIKSQSEGSTVETLLVLDSTTGQNAVNQAEMFSTVADVSGIVLTKLDGTAKGGIVIPICAKLKIPVKLVGVGEKIGDLSPFDPHDFVDALFSSDTEFEGNYDRLDEPDYSDTEISANLDSTEDIGETPEEPVQEKSIDFSDNGDIFNDSENDTKDNTENTDTDIDTDTQELLVGVAEELETEQTETAESEAQKKKGKFSFLFEPISFGKKKNDSNSDQ
jgi:hypothetical protein